MNWKPQLSYDGVAVLLAAVSFAVWCGVMKTKVETIEITIQDHEFRIRKNEAAVIRFDPANRWPKPQEKGQINKPSP